MPTWPTMRRLGSVQRKLPCVFVTEVQDIPSGKREAQPFRVVATEKLNPCALDSSIHSAVATEKLDGTCCYVSLFKGKPYLWARLDKKPTKQADKRFRKFQASQGSSTGFTWDLEVDFKTVPENWVSAKAIEYCDGKPLPDEHGHIPGWVPVEGNNKQYCWHSAVVDYETQQALLLRPRQDEEDLLEITCVPLDEVLEQTLELIGTNVNGNPYGLGSKKNPIHFLVPHGVFPIREAPHLNHEQLSSWFMENDQGKVEGIVWHCNNGSLFKLHRHHLNLPWPSGSTWLNARPLVVHVDWHTQGPSQCLFSTFAKFNGQQFCSIDDIKFEA